MKMTLTKEVYLRNKAIWKAKAQAKDATAFETLAWLMMADKNIAKAFQGVHTEKGLAKIAPQAKHPQYKLEKAWLELHWAMTGAKKTNVILLRKRFDAELKKFVPLEAFEVTPEFVDEFFEKFTKYEDLLYPPAIPLPVIQEIAPIEVTTIAAAA